MQRIHHNDIKDMPDVAGTNSDHDGRYIKKRDFATIKTLTLLTRSADPDDPPEGNAVIWMSDGTGSGDDGDIMIKSTNGSSTTTGTLLNHT